MKSIKIIPVLLLLVMAFQMMPVKQAVKYFFIDNQTSEELAHIDKGATKNFRLLEEDQKWIYDNGQVFCHFIIEKNTTLFHFEEMLPLNHVIDIHTPPPNKG